MFDPYEREKGVTDDLRWYEVLFCCCKCRAKCKSCVTTTFLYFVPIILLILLGTACIVIGVCYRFCCPYETRLPYWVLVSAANPFPLLAGIKALKDDYYGMTAWRYVFLFLYFMFLASIVLGSIITYNTLANASATTSSSMYCNEILKWFAFGLTIAHWLVFIVATAAQVYIFTRVCCCCTENAIKPLKMSVSHDYGLNDVTTNRRY